MFDVNIYVFDVYIYVFDVNIYVFDFTHSAAVTPFLNSFTSTIYHYLYRYLSTFITHNLLDVFQMYDDKSAK